MHKNKRSVIDLIMFYGIFVTLIALGSTMIMRVVFKEDFELLFKYGASIHYLILSILLATILPIVLAVVLKGVVVTLDVKAHKSRRR